MSDEEFEDGREITIDLDTIEREVVDRVARMVADKVVDKLVERIASEKLGHIIDVVLHGGAGYIFYPNLALNLASMLADRLAKMVRIEVGDNVRICIGSRCSEIDVDRLISEIRKRIEKILSNKINEIVRQAIEEVLAGG